MNTTPVIPTSLQLKMLRRFMLVSSLAVTVSSPEAAESGNSLFIHDYFIGSGHCAVCHNDISDSAGRDLSIETAWSTSMMANAARDPYWRAKVASELHRNPGLSPEINDKCSRCHTPMANDTYSKEGKTPLIFTQGTTPGFLDPANGNYFDMAIEGVSCALCHQIQDNGLLGSLDGISGKFSIADYLADGTPIADRPMYGQYSGVNPSPMQNTIDFLPIFGAHISTSEQCATCHDLKTPFVDANGLPASTTPESEFPEQMVYSEWKHSDYEDSQPLSQSCQDCHMRKVREPVPIASRPASTPSRLGFSEHKFLGANTVMLDILNRNKFQLGVSATGFENTILETRNFLRQSATISVNYAFVVNQQLEINLRINNLAGHKFPTGYPSRRAYIHFVVRKANSAIIFESGAMASNGSISGVATDSDTSTYEPHYQTITSADQVQVYEPIMQNTDMQVTHTLLRAASYVKDNRLLPKGFDKSSAVADIAVRGQAAADLDFVAGQDDISYRIDLSTLGVANGENLSIEAELRYQPLAYGHLQDLFNDSTSVTQVSDFQTLFEQPNSFYTELVDSAQTTAAYTPGCTGSTIHLADLSISSLFVCEASLSLSAKNITVTSASGDLQLISNSLELLPGFSVQAPATFSGRIIP